MYDNLDDSKKQATKWYFDMQQNVKKEWDIFIIPTLSNLLHMSNDQHVELYKKALFVIKN